MRMVCKSSLRMAARTGKDRRLKAASDVPKLGAAAQGTGGQQNQHGVGEPAALHTEPTTAFTGALRATSD